MRRLLLMRQILLMTLLVAPAWAQDGFDDEDEVRAPTVGEMTAAQAAWRASCAPCHGLTGDGRGPAARWLDTPPRDFTRGEFKWRSTPSGALPTDADILRTIDAGALGTPMPGWAGRLPARTRLALVQVVKSFSPRFGEQAAAEPLEVPEVPAVTEAALAAGQVVYERLKCGECHGADGRGDGPAAHTLKDSQDRPIRARDFTVGNIKRGATPEALYLTFMTGLDGTPMPAFDQTTRPEERWPLVFYTLSLREERGLGHWLFGPLEEQN
jgi:mono/diheme cytochrome c family protein